MRSFIIYSYSLEHYLDDQIIKDIGAEQGECNKCVQNVA